MTDVAALLAQTNVSSALIVDDAYDETPLAMDLARDAEEWTHFFEDMGDDDKAVLRELYPNYDNARADELQGDDAFVAALWQGGNRLRSGLIRSLRATATPRKPISLTWAR